MEPNEQTELTRKIGTDSEKAGWQLVDDGRLWGGGTEQKGKRFKDMDTSEVIAGQRDVKGD